MLDTDKLREAFPNTTIYKDQSIMAIFKAASISGFLRDWILKKQAGPDGKIADPAALQAYFAQLIPGRDQTFKLKSRAQEGGTRKFLARIETEFNVSGGYYSFAIPDLGIQHSQTLIEFYIWDKIKTEVVQKAGGWGLIQLGYVKDNEKSGGGKLTLLDFKNFCPYKVDIEAYREARKKFTTEEWMDVLLGAIDYNADGYGHDSWVAKHTMLTRLLPFIAPRINLVELAPKGTGKSYLFGSVGKYGWLASGGTLTRAKMFSDINGKQPGLVASNDFVALDEIQSIRFPDPGEMQGALKAYMESGEATLGKTRIVGEAGIILLGNIPFEQMDETQDMFRNLPEVFHESALLDRFHGFIRGRDIPRMSENLVINGWALNTEYFTEIMHLLRSSAECMTYRNVVEQLVTYSDNADFRSKEAILRLCTAYLKLFFPHAVSPELVDKAEFHQYCLRPAINMRSVIWRQLQIIDPKEFGNKKLGEYTVK